MLEMGVPRPRIPTPAVPHVPPLWRESRMAFEAAQLLRSPVWRGKGVERGQGRPVLLVPGFMAGDGTLATMSKWLRANGYWTRRAGIRSNIGCSQKGCELLEERLEALAERTGERVAIIGQSRGGVLARAVAVRRPDLVSGIVTLGAPTVSMLRVHPLVLLQVGLVGALGTGRVPGLFSVSCLRGPCCAPFRADMAADFPADVALHVPVLALGRHRRLARVPGPGRRRARRGVRLPLRDGAQPRASTRTSPPRSPASGASRR